MNKTQAIMEGAALLSKAAGVMDFALVGSAVYTEQPRDVDFLVLLEHKPDELLATPFVATARSHFTGFALCGGEYDDQDDKWLAVRKGDINLIITYDKGWYDRSLLSSKVCQLLNVASKEDRVALYQLVRDGMEVVDARNSAKESLAKQGQGA